ncbi:flavodoxin family protein [uncultured Deefgea sp.]|uniref:flavodoxin family protein n=1 Tax=uncultured Deefgea sp. TaxID=1304914 RepID=UPI002598A6B9|nr:flavodoxin family protein [uncultured Deefgea sp.]
MHSPTTLIVYHSAAGSTEQLAKAIYAGATEIDSAALIALNPADIVAGRYVNEGVLQQVDQASAIIFGTPTYMGGASAQFKAFADATSERWCEQRWADKLAAGFTIGANLSGDQLSTLTYLSIFSAQHGMLWCGLDLAGGYDAEGRNRLGCQLGLTAHSLDGQIHEIDQKTAFYLGQRIARLAQRFK